MAWWQQSQTVYNNSLNLILGEGVAKDPEKAFLLNAEAADRGHADAVLAMGWFYLNGIGVEFNMDRARKWYRESARRGNPMAMFSLGQISCFEGEYSEGMKWFIRASESGHSRSFYWIGKLYWRGHGAKQDKKNAMRFFHRAATKKVREAQRVLRFFARKSPTQSTRKMGSL